MRLTPFAPACFTLALLLAGCSGDGDATDTATPEDAPTTIATGTATAVEPAGDTPTAGATVGTEAPLAGQSVAEADGVRVVLLQVTDPWEQPPDQAVPPAGSHFVQIAVTVENHSNATFTVGFDSFVFMSTAGSSEGIRVNGADPYLMRQDLPPEAAIQGFVVGVVEDGETLVGVSFDADASTSEQILFGEAPPEEEETPEETETPTASGTPGEEEETPSSE